MLKNAGLDFDKHYECGIDQYEFAALLKGSSLISNQSVTWVAFNASFDFAYMVKILDYENTDSNAKILPQKPY